MSVWLKILLFFVVFALLNTLMIGVSVLSQKKEDKRRENRRKRLSQRTEREREQR